MSLVKRELQDKIEAGEICSLCWQPFESDQEKFQDAHKDCYDKAIEYEMDSEPQLNNGD